MSEKNTSIHEFDFNLICEYFSKLKRQGPGSKEVTLKALSFIENINKNSLIADIGCGTGGQTMTIAQNTKATVLGIDLSPIFIDIFNKNIKKQNLAKRVKGEIASMDKLNFEKESLDLIWAEGSIYNIGFKKGLKEWHKFLKQGGYIAISEASWFTEERPEEIERFWKDAYPEIDTISKKISQMQKSGYVPMASFILPESCWIDNFYKPQASIQEKFLKKYPDNEAVKSFIESERHEAKLYEKYKDFYGYVFYIGKKI